MCKITVTMPVIPGGATDKERRALEFDYLSKLDLSSLVEKRGKLTYLSWANCLGVLMQAYPSAEYRVIKNPNGLPYFVDEKMGIMVYTEITINGRTTECFLPVMDSKNKAMRLEPYTYQTWDDYKKTYVDKSVEAATMFDVNKTIWRTLVKNVAIATGIGLYIFQGEDVPATDDQTNEQPTQAAAPVAPPQPVDRFTQIKNAINSKADIVSLDSLYWEHEAEINGNPEIKAVFQQRRSQLQLLTQGRTA